MQTIDIANPTKTLIFDWPTVKAAVQRLAGIFPKEYKIIADNGDDMVFLITALTPPASTIPKDQLVYLKASGYSV
jgi:hypothetical protein